MDKFDLKREQSQEKNDTRMQWNKVNLSPVILNDPVFQSFLKSKPKIIKTETFEYSHKDSNNQVHSGIVSVPELSNESGEKQEILYSFICYNVANKHNTSIKPQKMIIKEHSIYTSDEKKNLKFFDFLKLNQNRKIKCLSFLSYVDESAPTKWHVKTEMEYDGGLKEVLYHLHDKNTKSLVAKDYVEKKDGHYHHSFLAKDFLEKNVTLIGKFETTEENVSLLEQRMKRRVEIIAFNTVATSEELMDYMGYDEIIDLIESDKNQKNLQVALYRRRDQGLEL